MKPIKTMENKKVRSKAAWGQMGTFLLLARMRLSVAWLACCLLAWRLYQRWIVTAAWFTCWINLQIHKSTAMSHRTTDRRPLTSLDSKHTVETPWEQLSETVQQVWPLSLLLSDLPPARQDRAAALGRHWRFVVWGGGNWREILLGLCQGAVVQWHLIVCCGLQDVAERRIWLEIQRNLTHGP